MIKTLFLWAIEFATIALKKILELVKELESQDQEDLWVKRSPKHHVEDIMRLARCEEGKVYGNWRVKEKTDKLKKYSTCSLYYCLAECLGCGNVFEVCEGSLLYKKSNQCGSCGRKLHGQSATKTYNQWRLVKYSPNLKFCKRWEVFANFYKDLGSCPDGQILCRRDQKGIFSPNNSYWGDPVGQVSRRRPALVFINNKSYSYRKLGELCGVSRTTIWCKLKKMSPEELLKSYGVTLDLCG